MYSLCSLYTVCVYSVQSVCSVYTACVQSVHSRALHHTVHHCIPTQINTPRTANSKQQTAGSIHTAPTRPAYRIQQNSGYPDAGYPDRLGLSGTFVENSTKPSCLAITGCRPSAVQCCGLPSAVRGSDLCSPHSNSRTANCQCGQSANKNPIILVFCTSKWLVVH
jgi:hypothetical protein